MPNIYNDYDDGPSFLSRWEKIIKEMKLSDKDKDTFRPISEAQHNSIFTAGQQSTLDMLREPSEGLLKLLKPYGVDAALLNVIGHAIRTQTGASETSKP